MLDSVKNKQQRNALLDILKFIVTGTQSESGFAFVPKAEAEKLHKAEPHFVELDITVTNAEGQIKAVATAAAIEALSNTATANSTPASSTPAAAPKEQMTYEIGTLEVLPAIMRGGHKAESYPFDKLAAFPEKGNYFLVPATEAKPNPAKSLASTVASATKRYKGERTFTVRKHTVDGKIVGALVVRIK
jgi:hypothetical protein